MQNLLQDAVNQALETVAQYDDIETAIENFYDETPVDITEGTAKALLIFSSTIVKRHSDKNPILLFEALRKSRHDFKGALKPLNNLTVRDFVNLASRDFNISEISKSIETEVKKEEEVVKFKKGDIVQLLDDKTYAVVELDSDKVVWTTVGIRKKNANLRKITEKNEKQMAYISINWKMGAGIYCRNQKGDVVAKFMIVQGDNEGDFKLLNLANHEIITDSNTNSKYNLAHFIVNNVRPASVEVM